MDRILEADSDALPLPANDDDIRDFIGRLAPLWASCTEDDVRGLVFNFGWLIDLVTEYSGDPHQRLPVRSKRFSAWADLTYADLSNFVSRVIDTAALLGVPELRVGPMFTGVGEFGSGNDDESEEAFQQLYDERGTWYRRHPEIYPVPVQTGLLGPGLDSRVPLKADNHRYASRPQGITEGEDFATFLGDQWAALTDLVPFGVINLRDGWAGPMMYQRIGPDGTSVPSPWAEVISWTDSVAGICRELKLARPEALVMMYSSAVAPTADWRVGCLDTQRLVADGHLDIWIDQTWGGAWQDWWDMSWKGWTFQLAYLVQRGAVIAAGNSKRETPCRHYKLIQALDGWEPYDTMHDYPGKLKWAMWAFAHASSYDSNGNIHVPDGSYVAMMNDRVRGWVSERDVTWLAAELDAAEASANGLEEVYGPVMVHDRDGLQDISERHASENASEWYEEYVGLLLKWGAPILSAVAAPHLPRQAASRGMILQASTSLSPTVTSALQAGTNVLVTGRADLLPPPLLAAAGITATSERIEDSGYHRGYPTSGDLRPQGWVFLPSHAKVTVLPEAAVLYSTADTPLLTEHENLAYWQSPDWADPALGFLPHFQLGSVEPHIETARMLHRQATRAGQLALDEFPSHQTVTMHAWRSRGVVYVLLGNLESGWIGDSRYPRAVSLRLPLDCTAGMREPALRPLAGAATFLARHDETGLVFDLTLPAESLLVARLEDAAE